MRKDKKFIKQRIIATTMSLVMAITLIPTTAFATAPDGNFRKNLEKTVRF